MSTFLTSLPDQIGVEPNEQEREGESNKINTKDSPLISLFAALQNLRNVVRLLDRENEQFRKDCEEKLAFQRQVENNRICSMLYIPRMICSKFTHL